MSQYKLKRKFVYAYLLALLPYYIFVFFLFDQWTDIRRQTFYLKNYQLANSTSTVTEYFLDKVAGTTRTIALDPQIASLSKDSALPVFYRFYTNLPYNTNLYLSDSKGSLLYNFQKPKETEKPDYFSSFSFWQKMLTTKNTVISDYDSKDPNYLYVATPILNKENQIIGAVVATPSLETLLNEIRPPEINTENTSLFVLDQDKNILLTTKINKEEVYRNRTLLKNDPALKEILANNSQGTFDNYKNVFFPKIVSGVISSVSNYNWAIVIAGPLENQMEPITMLQVLFVVVSFLTFILVLLTITFFIHKFLSFL